MKAPNGQSARSPALAGRSRFPVRVHYCTKNFGEDRWAIHYYAVIEGHELVTRRGRQVSGGGFKCGYQPNSLNSMPF